MNLLDFGHGNGDLADHVALEDDAVADAAFEGAGQFVAVFEDDVVRGCLFLSDRWSKEGARDQAQRSEAQRTPHPHSGRLYEGHAVQDSVVTAKS